MSHDINNVQYSPRLSHQSHELHKVPYSPSLSHQSHGVDVHATCQLLSLHSDIGLGEGSKGLWDTEGQGQAGQVTMVVGHHQGGASCWEASKRGQVSVYRN